MSTPPAVALRQAPVRDETLARSDFQTLTGLARAAGLAPSTLARCRRGELAPGPSVIAGLMRATGRPFEDLFEVTDPDA